MANFFEHPVRLYGFYRVFASIVCKPLPPTRFLKLVEIKIFFKIELPWSEMVDAPGFCAPSVVLHIFKFEVSTVQIQNSWQFFLSRKTH
jgi:hypothetical protein